MTSVVLCQILLHTLDAEIVVIVYEINSERFWG